MRDFISIGQTPTNELCAQVGDANYEEQSFKECQAFIMQLRRVFGIEPLLSRLSIRTFPHDFGSYREVVCYYSDKEARDYVFKLESECPANWDDVARRELGLCNM